MGLAVVSKALYYRLLKKHDWFWLVQMALLFPLIASFRSVGWTAAALACKRRGDRIRRFCLLRNEEHEYGIAILAA